MLAELYHLHHQTHLEDIPFWLDLAEKYGDPILELGCGTGRVSLPLLHQGFKVTGVDRDSEMLGILKNELESNDKFEYTEQDFTSLSLPKQFPLIIMPCNTYSTLKDEDRKSVLEIVENQPEQKGPFAFSMPNPAWMVDLPSEGEPELEEIFVYPKSGNAVQVSSAWTNDGNIIKVLWHYDQMLPEGNVKRFTAETEHQLIAPSKYFDELEEYGFKINTYGDFDQTTYSPDSEYLIIVAEK